MAKVTGLDYVCVHTSCLEKTYRLYREILQFELYETETLTADNVKGMLVSKLRAGNCEVHISLPSSEHMDTLGPVGNTNHNHFMLSVEGIKEIGDKLKAEGYELENEEYECDGYTFFTGPNGEIIGICEWPE